MADLYLAHHAPLELFRGVTRRISISLFEKATGGDTVAGLPTAALSKGAAEDWSDYPIVVAGLAPATPVYDADGVKRVVQLRCDWFTTNPAVLTLIIESDMVEEALALLPEGDVDLIFTVAAYQDTLAVIEEGLVLVQGPVYVTETAVIGGMTALP